MRGLRLPTCAGPQISDNVTMVTDGQHLERGTIAVIVDVDGVVSPVGGPSDWGDDVHAGSAFGGVHVSPALCARLDQLAALPGVECWWLTSWTAAMRREMDPFPGSSWPVVADPEAFTGDYETRSHPLFAGRSWWKWEALRVWLPQQRTLAGLVWCEDHLRRPDETWLFRDVVRQQLEARGIPSLLLGPETQVGLTPRHMNQIDEWVNGQQGTTAGPAPGS